MFSFLFQKKDAHTEGMFVVFDIGGTKMRVAGVVDGELRDARIEPTPQNPQEGIQKLVSLIKDISKGEALLEVSGCIAGRIDSDGKLYGARNLSSWVGIELPEQLQKALRVPVFIANDAEFAGLGEAMMGAGRGSVSVAYITVSTGVGGALIKNGTVDSKSEELEVSRIPVAGGDLEGTVSGTAVKKHFGIEAKNLDSKEERKKLADILAEGLKEVIAVWKPDMIVLGGSMIVGTNEIPLDEVEVALHYGKHDASESFPQIRKAELGDLGGLYGALVYIKQKTKK